MKRIITILTIFLAALTAGAQNADQQSGKGAARTLDHMTTYNADGKKMEETEYDSAGRQKWRKRFEWGANGRLARELVYDERNRLENYKKFEYNEFGKRKVQYTYDTKGRLTGTKVYEYIVQEE